MDRRQRINRAVYRNESLALRGGHPTEPVEGSRRRSRGWTIRGAAVLFGRLSRLTLPLAGATSPEVPLYLGDRPQLLEDVWELMRGRAVEAVFPISYPSKMDCPAWGISAARCRVGTRLREVLGSTCRGCYAMKGTFRTANVVRKLEEAFEGLHHPKWTAAGVAVVRMYAGDRFRWFHSGDLLGVNHLRNIIRVCLETPDVLHWLPTREVDTVFACRDALPGNLRVRLSAPMVDGPAPANWPATSTVVTDPRQATCPSSKAGGNCGTHGCTACWSDRGNVSYLRH